MKIKRFKNYYLGTPICPHCKRHTMCIGWKICDRDDCARKKKKKRSYSGNQKRYCDLSIQSKIASNLRTRIRISLKSKNTIKSNKTMTYVGCSKEQLIKHLQKKFKKGMSWENYGKWEIDHIYPLSKFDLTVEENIYEAMNFQNLQPLWKHENRKKSASIDKSVIHKHIDK